MTRAPALGTATAGVTTLPTPRIESLDQYRGCLIFLMIAANLLNNYDVIPAWLRHSCEFGRIHLIDIGVSLFMFTVGLSLGLATARSLSTRGAPTTIRRFVCRDFVLIAFGLTGALLQKRGVFTDWEVFQSIGLASLIALPFVFLAPVLRITVGLGLVSTFHVLGALGYWNWLKSSDVGGMGGVLGSLAWGGIILFGSGLSGLLQGNWRGYRNATLVMGIVGIGAGLILARFMPLDKRLITMPYVLFTTGIAAFAALLFGLLVRVPDFRFWPFKVMGTNALVIFMLHAVLILGILAVVPPGSPLGPVALALLALYAVCFLIAGWLYHRRILIRL